MVIIKCGQKQRVLKVSYHMCTKLLDGFLAVRFECTQLTQDNRMFFLKQYYAFLYGTSFTKKTERSCHIFGSFTKRMKYTFSLMYISLLICC